MAIRPADTPSPVDNESNPSAEESATSERELWLELLENTLIMWTQPTTSTLSTTAADVATRALLYHGARSAHGNMALDLAARFAAQLVGQERQAEVTLCAWNGDWALVRDSISHLHRDNEITAAEEQAFLTLFRKLQLTAEANQHAQMSAAISKE